MSQRFLNQFLSLASSTRDKILILGLGRENLQFVDWALNVLKVPYDKLILADANPNYNLDSISPDVQKIERYFGPDYLGSLERSEVKLVIKAPGIWSLRPELQAFRQRVGSDSIHSSMVFFFEKFRDRIVAVNGTKGKTTTCNLLKQLLQGQLKNHTGQQLKVEYCGNTSNVSPYQFWTEQDSELEDYFFVVETSSFQLQDLGFAKISPKYGVITNYYIDHLDQHAHRFEYWLSKDNLFLNQKPGDFLFISEIVEDNLIYRADLATKDLANYTNFFRNMPPSQCYVIEERHIGRISSVFDSVLVGQHNWLNQSLALIASETIIRSLKTKDEPTRPLTMDSDQIIEQVIQKKDVYQPLLLAFTPVFGRMQLVQTKHLEDQTIRFFNDTAATEPEAVIAAIRAVDEPKWLLLSGKVKQGMYEDLIAEIEKQIREDKIIGIGFFGQVGDKLLGMMNPESLARIVVKKGSIKTFWQSIHLTDLLSQSTDKQQISVILSPCGSSFDEFNNYIERGNMFIDWAKSP